MTKEHARTIAGNGFVIRTKPAGQWLYAWTWDNDMLLSGIATSREAAIKQVLRKLRKNNAKP